MKFAGTVAAIFAAISALASPHPGNARAAAACSSLFFDDGDFDEAKFFATLAQEEAFEPEALLANARIAMHEGRLAYASMLRAIARDPSLSVAPPLPSPALPADADQSKAQCRALAPPLFPEPFDARRLGRDAEERVWQPGDASIMDMPRPCVQSASWEIVVGSDGRVESVTVLRAAFRIGGDDDVTARIVEEQFLVPIVMRQHYKPGKIRGVPIRSVTRASIARYCE